MLTNDGLNVARPQPRPPAPVDVSALTVAEAITAVHTGKVAVDEAVRQEQAGRGRIGVLRHLGGMR